MAQIEDGLRTDYIQDVAAPLPQVLTAQQGGTVSKYLRGLGLIGEQTGGTGPNAAPAAWQYALPDALGSVRQVVDAQGQLLLTQRFDPFGGLVERSTLNVQTRYGFAGEEQDKNGQLFLRARTYNPSTGRFLQSDPVMGTPSDPRTLHNYAYAFNNPVNLVDPSGLMPFTLQRQQRQNQNLAVLGRQNSYAVQPDTQVGYVGAAVGQGGFNTSYLGQAAQPDGMAAPRAAMGQAEQNWQSFSDPFARQQSQGFRPKACGFTDVLFGFGSSALNGNLLKDSFEFVQHGREIALSLMPMELWELGFQLAVGFSPLDLFYDLGSLVVGQDIVSGEALTDTDRAIIFAGFLTLGLGDDLIKAGKKLNALKQADEMATGAKADRNLFGRAIDLFQSKGLRGGLKHVAANIGQKLTHLFDGAKRQAGNLREWVGNIFRKTGDDLPGGSRQAQKFIDRSAELAKLELIHNKTGRYGKIGASQSLSGRSTYDNYRKNTSGRSKLDSLVNGTARRDLLATGRSGRKGLREL